MQVVPASLLQAHPVLAQMTGDQVDDWSFILQTVHDLPAASSDVLVIVEVEIDFAAACGHAPILPAASRRVCRIPQLLVRDHILSYAGVRNYCRAQNDASCTITVLAGLSCSLAQDECNMVPTFESWFHLP